MKTMNRMIQAALGLLALGMAANALASPINVTITGTVINGTTLDPVVGGTDTATGIFAALADGTPITATLTYNVANPTLAYVATDLLFYEDNIDAPMSSFTVNGMTGTSADVSDAAVDLGIQAFYGATTAPSAANSAISSAYELGEVAYNGDFSSVYENIFEEVAPDTSLYSDSGATPTGGIPAGGYAVGVIIDGSDSDRVDYLVTSADISGFKAVPLGGPSVPAPLSSGLLALGMLGLAASRRRPVAA